MVQYYSIAGSKVGSHYLAIATLTTMFAGSWMMMGGKKTEGQKGPPINAQSKDEESFIREFIKSAEQEGKTGPKAREGAT